MKKLWELAKGFAAEEDAVGVVEIILILVVQHSLVNSLVVAAQKYKFFLPGQLFCHCLGK